MPHLKKMLFAVALLTSVAASAQGAGLLQPTSLWFSERRQSQSVLMHNPHGNMRVLSSINDLIEEFGAVARLDSILVEAWGSPEGDPEQNMQQARERAGVVRAYIATTCPEIDLGKVVLHTQQIDRTMVCRILGEPRFISLCSQALKVLSDSDNSDDIRLVEQLLSIDGGDHNSPVMGTNGVSDIAASWKTEGQNDSANVACTGHLFYNKNTNRSLFFPASGYRKSSDGSLLRSTIQWAYWTSSSQDNNTA
ncbi:hypothetical protein FACS1894159_08000 [Bacteroidia bacterium]|nr:hypothetical protein FACS1894159_08000 [Bacteroidia bacterium]